MFNVKIHGIPSLMGTAGILVDERQQTELAQSLQDEFPSVFPFHGLPPFLSFRFWFALVFLVFPSSPSPSSPLALLAPPRPSSAWESTSPASPARATSHTRSTSY